LSVEATAQTILFLELLVDIARLVFTKQKNKVACLAWNREKNHKERS